MNSADRRQLAVTSLLELIGGGGAQVFLRPRPLAEFMLGVREWTAILMELQDKRSSGEISADLVLPTVGRITNAMALAALQRQIGDAAIEGNTKLAVEVGIDADALRSFVLSLQAFAVYANALGAEGRLASVAHPESMALLGEFAAELEDVAEDAPEMAADLGRFEPLFSGEDATFAVSAVPLREYTAAASDVVATNMDLLAQCVAGHIGPELFPPRRSRLLITLVWAVTQFQVVDAAHAAKEAVSFGLPLDPDEALLVSNGLGAWRDNARELADTGLVQPLRAEADHVIDEILRACDSHAVSGG